MSLEEFTSVRDRCELHYREYGSGDPLIILHGFLGSGSNWHSIALNLSGRFRVITVDQRNHGSSPWIWGMDYPSMAADVLRLLDTVSIDRSFLLGHSMGGKTTMETALAFPDRFRGMVVVDIAPVAYPPEHRDILKALLDLDISGLQKRSEADALLSERVPDRMLRLFLLKNLKRTEEGSFTWRINLPGIVADYGSVWTGIEDGRTYTGPVLFIAGGKGGYLTQEDRPAILRRFSAAKMVSFENAGHWVHTEQRERFTKTVLDFFSGG